MKLMYPRSTPNFLGMLCPLSDVNYYPILTHAVALLVSTAASWHWQRGQYNWSCKVIASVVIIHETRRHKNYPGPLETHLLSIRKGYHCWKHFLSWFLLAATQKLGQPITKVSCTYAPPHPASSCCTVGIFKWIYIHSGSKEPNTASKAEYQPIGKSTTSPSCHTFTRWARPEEAGIDPGWTCKYE